VGAARACFDTALAYARERIAFGVPIARKQLVQGRLVAMAQEIAKAQLLIIHLARRKEHDPERGVSPWQVSLAKRNNVAMALDVARSARAILGAAGLSTEHPVIRHMLNLETLFTYEGTDDVHALILGRALTGENGF
jgi:glutaryl-CoA dehydrogenase